MLPAQIGCLHVSREYRYGRVAVSLYRKNNDLEQSL